MALFHLDIFDKFGAICLNKSTHRILDYLSFIMFSGLFALYDQLKETYKTNIENYMFISWSVFLIARFEVKVKCKAVIICRGYQVV